MKIFEAFISDLAVEKILPLLDQNITICNKKLQSLCGIIDFFESETDLIEFIQLLKDKSFFVEESNRFEYGDFQTNLELARHVCSLALENGFQPNVVIEPTCGKGNFIIAALTMFSSLERIIGIEIHRPYIWQTKFSILEYYLVHPTKIKPSINLFHHNIFDFDIKQLISVNENVLILGNPPWVTNSDLSAMGSDNLPIKSNFKNHSGLDAITGKGNFDIAEFISLNLINSFHQTLGAMAFLIKNAVVKNILYEQKQNNYQISNIKRYIIDAKKEFNVSVDASLFLIKFGERITFNCQDYDFYTHKKLKSFGWTNGAFVSDIDNYQKYSIFDGQCPFVWRQGMKHDCSNIMELEPSNGFYSNGFGDLASLEPDLVFPLLKSSDLKHSTIEKSRKVTIVTQKKPGQDTNYIRTDFPLTWNYLSKNTLYFENRKSSIYKNKPVFSIFGIGDYSFFPFKVAISGMYKTSTFSLVLPIDGKPVMLDDTCYFIGFENHKDALITQAILNSKPVQWFLNSIIFWDSKRAITKDVLSRLDLTKIIRHMSSEDLSEIPDTITQYDWATYCQNLIADNSQPYAAEATITA